MRGDRGVAAPEELSLDELIALVGVQAQRITAQDGQITTLAGELAALTEANEAFAGKLARLEHLSRNSEKSSSPPSKDDQPGRTRQPARGVVVVVGRSGPEANSPGRRDEPGVHR